MTIRLESNAGRQVREAGVSGPDADPARRRKPSEAGCARARSWLRAVAQCLALCLPLLAAIATGQAPRAESHWTDCDGGGIKIAGVTGEALAANCKTARATVEFLQGIGLSRVPPIEINIVAALPGEMPHALGCFDWNRKAIYLLTPEACAGIWGEKEFFQIPNDAEVYRSFLVHEVAHAVAEANFAAIRPTHASQEYLAAVAQLSLLEETRRDRLLSRFPGDGWDDADEISLLGYQLDPAWFAVESYRHYTKLENGPDFIRRVLSGEVILQDRLSY